MNIDFKLPELGENIHSGDVVNVLVQEGDVIAANDGVVELETDKAVVEIPCPHAGRVAKLLVKKGDTVKVGQAILTIAGGETAEPAAAAAQPRRAAESGRPRPPTRPAGLPRPPAAEAGRAGRARPPRPHSRRPGGAPPGTGAGRRSAHGRRQRKIRTHHAGRSPGSFAGSAMPAPLPMPPHRPSACAAGSQLSPADRLGLQPTVPPGESGRDAWGPVRVERISRIRRTIAAQMARSAARSRTSPISTTPT